LKSVSKILIQWDTDKIVPVYGYGAKINGNISHCFPMFNGEGVHEVDGIMNAYNGIIRNPNIVFSGPTNFAPTIRMMNAIAKNASLLDY